MDYSKLKQCHVCKDWYMPKELQSHLNNTPCGAVTMGDALGGDMPAMDERDLEAKYDPREQLIALIQEAKRQILVEKKPGLAVEALNAATDLIAKEPVAL